jgi:ABC-type sugar transport system substrate-binding protein
VMSSKDNFQRSVTAYDSRRAACCQGAVLGWRLRTLALVAAVVGGSLGTTVAISGVAQAANSAPLIYNIGAVVFPYTSATNEGVNAEAKQLGLRVVTANADGSVTTGVSLIKEAITSHAAGIVINPISSTGLVPAAKDAIAKGLCVVAMTDNFGPTTGVVYPPGAKGYVGWNEYYSGSLAGQWLARQIGYKGDVAVELGDFAHGASLWRFIGADRVWKKYPGIHVVSEEAYSFDLDTIRSQVLALVTKYGSALKGMLIDTNPGSVVAINAINTTPDRNKVAIVSVGGEGAMIKLIREGYPAGDVPEVPVQEGSEAVKLASDCIHGNRRPVDALEQFLPGVSVLKADNYVIDKSDVSVFKPDW